MTITKQTNKISRFTDTENILEITNQERKGGRGRRMKSCKLLYKNQRATRIYGITQGMQLYKITKFNEKKIDLRFTISSFFQSLTGFSNQE